MPAKPKKAVVVGAGIVGLATACRLAERGYDVEVIERADGPGCGSSKANAGQLLFERIGAMGSPGFLQGLPEILFDRTQGVRASGLLHPTKWGWTAKFLQQCTARGWQRNTGELLKMAHLSNASLTEFSARHDLSFARQKPGKLITYASQAGLDAAARAADFQGTFGGDHQILSCQDCLAREPALQGTSRKITGAIYLPNAETGDCHACCQQLARIFVETLSGRICYGVAVTGLVRKNDRISALRADKRQIEGDIFVLAAGIATNTLLPRRFSQKKPIIGVKGLSLTYPLGASPPRLSVTDASGKFVVMRLGDRIRITGYAMFTDDLLVDATLAQRLADKAQTLMPGAADWTAPAEVWAGLRPQTPDDLPMIGQAGALNLYVNAGHGSLGWTLAFGSAERLLQVVSEA